MYTILSSTVVREPPAPGARDATWTHRELPTLSVQRYGTLHGMCVLGGRDSMSTGQILSSCEALSMGDGEN